MITHRIHGVVLAALATLAPAASALAQATGKGLALDSVTVELGRQRPLRDDIQARNEGSAPIYVSVEPMLVRNPGKPDQRKVGIADPDELGLLVTPRRFVLAPGEYRSIRIAAVGAASDTDRIYRVTIKPETGQVASESSVLNVVVGYEVLVMVRPAQGRADIVATRSPQQLSLRNAGASNALLFRGRLCDARAERCRDLPARRLYAGDVLELPLTTPEDFAEFQVDDGDGTRSVRY